VNSAVLLAALIPAALVAMAVRDSLRVRKDWTRPYDVRRQASRYAQHVAALEAADTPERDKQRARVVAGEAVRARLLALWRAPMRDRRPSAQLELARNAALSRRRPLRLAK
jgi:hypothetical protein